ncbi:MAG: hypothetical protein HN742_02520 [Lentisphaerae bacterium]|nr:hypothetical protein [Lentisphaerota bacterium]MBT4819666.1 hypothetical protein [Lentisphaerota bacterium]MBT5608050.1 hypothetical protein [Lentisphaerota bacterium]MBT7056482.1 hypothetical protein [Lentisphaerota bacterium]MBT7840713.1 hypothetical protein [Lentisphaerota bacterium]
MEYEPHDRVAKRVMSFASRHFLDMLSCVLILASLWFYIGVHRTRRTLKTNAPEAFHEGEIVQISGIVDGDEILLLNRLGGKTVLRLVGIKSFDATVSDPLLSEYGKICFEYLKSTAMDQQAQLVLDPKRVDTKGRLLGSLLLKDKEGNFTLNLSEDLIKRGYTLVYTRFDFAQMERYLEAEQAAVNNSAGLWSDSRIKGRAQMLKTLWNEERDND